MRIKTHVSKGDQVEVIAGNHKGKGGIFEQDGPIAISNVKKIS